MTVSEKMKDATTQTRAAAHSMADLARTLILAGVGAAGLAKDEAEALMERLVERGELAQKDARKMMDELNQRSKTQGGLAETRMEKQFEMMLGRMGIPSKADLAEVNNRIAVLSAKIDALMISRAQKPAEPPAAPPESTR